MNFNLSEEQKLIQLMAREYAEKALLPKATERDFKGHFPKELLKDLGVNGFLGMLVDPMYGGSGFSFFEYTLCLVEIAKIDASAAVMISVNNSLVNTILTKYGSETQKKHWLPKLCNGSGLGAFCLSEPEAGSDASSLVTTAELIQGEYHINGVKSWVTNAIHSHVFLVMCQTKTKKGIKEISCFAIDASTLGIQLGPKEDKMGIRSSDTRAITFTDVKVNPECLIGKVGEGYKIALSCLAGGRIGIAAQAFGIGARANRLAIKYANTRVTFGKKIIRHQGIGFKLAEMDTKVSVAQLVLYKAAWLKENNKEYIKEAAQAKLYCSTMANEVTTEAVQVHGANGYVREYEVERLMRDAKITQIYEGTSEIQKIVISKKLVQL